MSVVGSIEVDVVALIDPARVKRDVEGPAMTRVATQAGTQFGKTFSTAAASAIPPQQILAAAQRDVETGLVQIRDLQKQGKVSTDEYTAAMERQRTAYLRLQAVRGGAVAGASGGAGTAVASEAAALEVAAGSAGVSAAGRRTGLTLGKSIGGGLALSVGVGLVEALTRGLPAAIHAAGDLQSSIAQTRAVFGDASTAVESFAADSKRNLLLTRQEAMTTASVFGDLLHGAGVDQGRASALSVQLTGLGENLSAIHRIPVADTLAALQAGVEGNIAPLRRLGINLSDDRVHAEALALGLVKPVNNAAAVVAAHNKVAAATQNLAKVQREHGTGTLAAAQAQDALTRAQQDLTRAAAGTTEPLSANEALLARTELLLRDTQGTTGAAAGSMDDYAVASQHLQAQLGQLSTELGQKLLPYLVDGEKKLSAFVDQMESGTGAGGSFRDMLGSLDDIAHGIGDTFGWLHRRTQELEYGSDAVQRGLLDIAGVAASGLDKVLGTDFQGNVNGAITKTKQLQAELERAYHGGTVPINVVVTTTQSNQNPALHAPGFIGPTVAEGLAKQGVAGPYSQMQTGGTAVAEAKAAADKQAAADKYATDHYAEFQQAQRDAVQAAADAARAAGEKVTATLRGQLDTLRQMQNQLTQQRDRMLAFREGVARQAGAFTATTGLIGDPSLATTGGLVASLRSRVGAEKLFKTNLDALGRRGLDKDVLAELAQAGPEQRAFVSALTLGSDAQLKQFNALERTSRSQQQALSQAATDRQFGAGAQAEANARLARIDAQLTVLNKQIAAQPALTGKAVAQAEKNARVEIQNKQRTAGPR